MAVAQRSRAQHAFASLKSALVFSWRISFSRSSCASRCEKKRSIDPLFAVFFAVFYDDIRAHLGRGGELRL